MGTPYLQAYVATMESGAVYLLRVSAETPEAGAEAAANLAECLDRSPLWERGRVSPYPCNAEMRAAGNGFELLRGPENRKDI